MEKHVAKWKPKSSFTLWNLDLCQVFLLFFLISKFLRIAKNWVEDAITVSVKKKMPWILKIWKIQSVQNLPL